MTDPVYHKLKEDAVEVLKELWHLIFPAKKFAFVRVKDRSPSDRRR